MRDHTLGGRIGPADFAAAKGKTEEQIDDECDFPPLTYRQSIACVAAGFCMFILAMAAVVAVVKLGGG